MLYIEPEENFESFAAGGYSTPASIRSRLLNRFDIDDAVLSRLVDIMWREDLDPRHESDVAEGFRRIGLDPSDYGIC